MDLHIDRRVVLNPACEYENLYKWSLQELDADENKIRRDQIPWPWTLYFTASELALTDIIGVEKEFSLDRDAPRDVVVRERQIIRGKLKPGHPQDRPYRGTSYSMFGTDRIITSFELYIEKTDGPDAAETCRSWGCVSYTTDVDFRDETTEDCITFHLYVRPERFADYARSIAAGAVDEAILRVGEVAGFYSDWSPAISTDEVKVLTSDKDHKVEVPENCEIDPPRLGEVGEVELSLRRILNLQSTKPSSPDDPEDLEDHEEWEQRDVVQPQAGNGRVLVDPGITNLLSSLRTVAWVIAALLVLILVF